MHTIDTDMPEITDLRIHIAPVGYEIDRVVLPAKNLKADKVYLLVHENKSQDKATSFYETITKQLKKQNIEVALEYHNRLDLFAIIKSVKQLIEKENKNTLFVNLASGSKIQSIGCMMACMMFNEYQNVRPFYVEAKEYTGFSGKPISKGIKEIEYVPTYNIQKPDSKHIAALKIIKEHDKLTKKEMARISVEQKLITINAQEDNQSQATFASLDKNIIQPLLDKWKYITVEKLGRNRYITLTEEGKKAAEVLN
jgi:hypothetical protein